MRRPTLLFTALLLATSSLSAQNQANRDAPRPIEAGESLWAEELTWMEIRDLITAGKATTIIIGTGGV